MSLINTIKGAVGSLTDLALGLLALAIAVQLLVGSTNMSFLTASPSKRRSHKP